MTDAAVADDLRRARVAYGGLLVGEGITVVACGEQRDEHATAVGDDSPSVGVGLLTAVAAARNDLEQYLGETEDALETDLGTIAAPHLEGASPVVRSRERAAALAVRSRAVYLQTETAGRGWIRVRDATPSAFPDEEPFAGILALSTTVLADARDRIAAQPPVVRDRLAAALDETGL